MERRDGERDDAAAAGLEALVRSGVGRNGDLDPFLGKDGSGWRIFAVRSPDASEVFLHDTGTGQLALLATSVPRSSSSISSSKGGTASARTKTSIPIPKR